MTFSYTPSPAPGEPADAMEHLANSEMPRQIKPTTRRKFTPAPGINATSLAQVIGARQRARDGGYAGRRLTLPSKSARSTPPRLHPALQGMEQQETRVLPLLTHPTDRARGSTRQLEIVDGNVVLYRQSNFYVRTVYRPGQQVDFPHKSSGHTSRMPKVMPHQRERVAASETRRMPKAEVRETARSATLLVPLWLEIAVVLILLVGAVCLHAYNLSGFPAYAMDEGTYMQNAWAITIGKLSPYPYGYGHPPLGWMQIALWVKLTGLFTFGEALNSGRVLMLFYAAGDTLLLYLIVRHLGGSKSAALIGMAVFAFSPLSVAFQREVLLDNIAVFWLLFSLYLIVVSRSRLLYLTGAALALGLAVLSKEVLALELPAMIYAAWLHITPFQRKFALVTFTYITLAMLSLFVLMALLKGEFFPYAWHLPWDHQPHLSLLDTYIDQVQRGQNQGSILTSWYTWFKDDPLLLCAGVAAPAFNLLYGWRNRKHLLAGLLALSYWLLLVRGGVVYAFYLIPLIPLFALNVALALHVLLGALGKLIHCTPARAMLLLLMLSLLLPYDAIGAVRQASANAVLPQQQALTWIREHVPHNARVVISAYLYLDLRLPGGEGVGNGKPFPDAEVYWNVATDPAIRTGTLHDDWNAIDYLVVDNLMLNDLANNGSEFALLQQALAHSTLLTSFHAHDQLEDVTLQIYQVQHASSTPLVQNPLQRRKAREDHG